MVPKSRNQSELHKWFRVPPPIRGELWNRNCELLEKMKKHEMEMERYVDIKKVSQYTSLPVSTLYEWAGIGRIPSIKIGRRVLFDLKDIELVMDSFKRTSDQCEMTANKIVGDFHGNGI